MDQMVCLMSSTILFYALKAITCLILALFIGYIAFAQKYLIYGDFKLFWFSVRRAALRAGKKYFIQKPSQIAQVTDFGKNGPNPFL